MRNMRIALAGNANVGKSTIFNALTGLSQHIGNWPGKTVEKAEGKLAFKGRSISVVDLPGVYSLKPYSQEEEVAREYVRAQKPDVVINVVDASVLERNLFLTLSLIRMGRPVVVALNMVDVAERKGAKVDAKKLSRMLGVPVVPVIATRSIGLEQLIEKAVSEADKGGKCRPLREKSTEKVYADAERIARECITLTIVRPQLEERLDSVLMHRYAGYFFLVLAAALMFFTVFSIGDWASRILSGGFSSTKGWLSGILGEGFVSFVLLEGVFEGIAAAMSVALPYLIPFAIVLAILEDSGYLARMAFLMDTFMRKIGLHGKAFIPMILGYGCSVPACISCRIMETQRERFLSAFLVTLVPCAARSVIIMGLVAAFVGPEWAAFLYLFNMLIIAVLGRIAFRALPGEPMGLIMEMPSYKIPSIGNIVKTAWLKANSFLWIALPVIIVSTVLIKLVEFVGLISPISGLLSPITVGWLGLPAIAGITLIFGVLRKELALVMLAALMGTADFGSVLTPLQMMTFAIVSMYYIPCTATIAALAKEFGWKNSLAITVFEVVFALLLAGVAACVLGAFFF